MNPTVALSLGLLVAGLVVTGIILFLVFWLKSKKLKDKAPSFEGDWDKWKGINYDDNYIERGKLIHGRSERRTGSVTEQTRSIAEGEEEEIRRIRDQIARAERDLAKA